MTIRIIQASEVFFKIKLNTHLDTLKLQRFFLTITKIKKIPGKQADMLAQTSSLIQVNLCLCVEQNLGYRTDQCIC